MKYYAIPWLHVTSGTVTNGICCVSAKETPSTAFIIKETAEEVENFDSNKFHIMEVIEITKREFNRLTASK